MPSNEGHGKVPARRAILLLARSRTQLNELLRAARVLRKSERYEAIVFSDALSLPLLAELSMRCRVEGLAFEDTLNLVGPPEFPSGRSRVVRALISLAGWVPSLSFPLARSLGWPGTRVEFDQALTSIDAVVQRDGQDLSRFKALFKSKRAAALVVAEDGIGGSATAIQAARERGIPVIDLPYEYSNREQLLRGIPPNPPDRKAMEQVLVKWFPKWVIRGEPTVLTASPPHVALARQAQGLSPTNPTTVHGGQAHCIVVESAEMRAHYLREGIPERKLRDVGSLALDDLLSAQQRNPVDVASFVTGTKRVPGRTSILCSLVPDYVEDSGPKCDFATYHELLDFWIETLLTFGDADVVFKCHPAIGENDRDYLRTRVALSEEELASLLPSCDVFVTSVSSTIRWAIAARKPVINYDVYRFAYPDYLDAPGVIHADTRTGFVMSIRTLVEDADAYRAKTTDLAARSARWGVMDGKAGERFLDLVDELISPRERPGSSSASSSSS